MTLDYLLYQVHSMSAHKFSEQRLWESTEEPKTRDSPHPDENRLEPLRNNGKNTANRVGELTQPHQKTEGNS